MADHAGGSDLCGDCAAKATEDMQWQMRKYQMAFNKHGVNLEELFSTHCRSPYPEVAQKRMCIIRNTYLYLYLQLYASEIFVRELQHVMSNYHDLTFEEFAELIVDIAASAQVCASMAEFVRDLHAAQAEDMAVAMNMDAMLAKLDLERKYLEATRTELVAKGVRLCSKSVVCELLATAIATLSVVGAIPTAGISLIGLAPAASLAYVGIEAAADAVETTMRVAEVHQQITAAKDAAEAIASPIRKSLQSLSSTLAEATQFYSVLNAEVQAYKLNADRAAALQQNAETERLRSRLKRHYLLMKRPAANLVELCRNFDAAIIFNKTMLMRLVDGADHKDNEKFVKDWLISKLDRLQLDQEEGRSERLQLLPPSLRSVISSPGSRSGTTGGSGHDGQ